MEKRTALSVTGYLALTYAATFAVQIILIRNGIRFDGDVAQHTPLGWLLLTMWIPGLCGLAAALFVEGVPFKEIISSFNLRIGSVGPFFLTMLIAPLAFAAIYGLSWLFGLATLDLSLAALTQATGSEDPISLDTLFQLMLPLSVLIGPFMHFPFALGEEIGWRGFLLPRLMPLGKIRAYAILGIAWGLWHVPIIWVGFNYPDHPVAGIGMMCALTSAFGLFINEMTLHYQSTLLAGFIHGAINAQGFGIWLWLFPGIHPLLGGGTGLTAIAVWGLAGVITMRVLPRSQRV